MTQLQAEIKRIFKETFDKFGKIDSLVVNAGGTVEGAQMGSVAGIGEVRYDTFMDLNLKSVISICTAPKGLNFGAVQY